MVWCNTLNLHLLPKENRKIQSQENKSSVLLPHTSSENTLDDAEWLYFPTLWLLGMQRTNYCQPGEILGVKGEGVVNCSLLHSASKTKTEELLRHFVWLIKHMLICLHFTVVYFNFRFGFLMESKVLKVHSGLLFKMRCGCMELARGGPEHASGRAVQCNAGHQLQ